jgi:hypothetical protein
MTVAMKILAHSIAEKRKRNGQGSPLKQPGAE